MPHSYIDVVHLSGVCMVALPALTVLRLMAAIPATWLATVICFVAQVPS
jgi:hypothetical protein